MSRMRSATKEGLSKLEAILTEDVIFCNLTKKQIEELCREVNLASKSAGKCFSYWDSQKISISDMSEKLKATKIKALTAT